MAQKRYRPEEIIAKLREAAVLLGQGQKVPEVVKALGVSEVRQNQERPAPSSRRAREREERAPKDALSRPALRWTTDTCEDAPTFNGSHSSRSHAWSQ